MKSKLKGNQKRLQYTQYKFIEPAHWTSWAFFTLLHAGDIHYTNKALKYSCVYEVNPLLPNRPNMERLVAHKVVTLVPVYHPAFNRHVVTDREIRQASMFMALVIMHNRKVLDRVERNIDKCPKISTL